MSLGGEGMKARAAMASVRYEFMKIPFSKLSFSQGLPRYTSAGGPLPR